MYGTAWPVDHDSKRLSISRSDHSVTGWFCIGFSIETNPLEVQHFFAFQPSMVFFGLGHVKRNREGKKEENTDQPQQKLANKTDLCNALHAK